MNRFARLLLLVCMVGLLSSLAIDRARAESNKWPWTDAFAPPGGDLDYINPKAATLPVKPVEGVKYEDMVPDTYDVAEAARLAINALTCATSRTQDYEQYFSVYIGNPLRMAHNGSDWCNPKYMEALPLLRTVTGSTFMTQVDQVWQDQILKSIGPDGLFYFPIKSKPWYGKELWWSKGIALANGNIFTIPKVDPEKIKDVDVYSIPHASSLVVESGISQFTHPQPVGRIMKVLDIYYQLDGNPLWKEMMHTMFKRFNELVIKKDDYAYFPSLYFVPNAKYDKSDPKAVMDTGLHGGEIQGRFIRACALTYKLTGDKEALDLAKRLTNFMITKNQCFTAEGHWQGDTNFHGFTNYMIGMLEYAHVANDQKVMDFLRKSFEWAKTSASSFSPVTGWAPEWPRPENLTCEGCAVGDMVVLACNLSVFGAGDFFADAERWSRNMFAEAQLTRPKVNDLIRHGKTMKSKKLLYSETTDGVAERTLGSFTSWAPGNQWWENYVRGKGEVTDNLIMQCCTCNCTRALYFLWRSILSYKDGELKVNMLLNRASVWADVYSFIPYQGRVDVKMKQDCSSVQVHAPGWIKTGSKEITAQVDGTSRDFTWQGRYLSLGEVKKDQKITVAFPISETTVKERMGGKDYTLLLRGDTVVQIDPPGRIAPIFNRDYLREDEPRWRKVQRFVANTQIDY